MTHDRMAYNKLTHLTGLVYYSKVIDMKIIAVLVSGKGTNLQAIINQIRAGKIRANLAVVISNKKRAYALKRAQKNNIPVFSIEHRGLTRRAHEQEILGILDKFNPDLVVLAGYMRILTSYFISKYKNKIINIHPALCPSFPGANGYGDAYRYGVRVFGPTVHFVDEGLDGGPIILQRALEVKDEENLLEMKKRALKIEHQILPQAIKLFIEGRLKIQGKKVIIKK